MGDPPPTATIPSQPPARQTSSAAATAASVGLGGVSRKTAAPAGRRAVARSSSPLAAIPRSETTSGRPTPRSVSAAGRPAISPGPKSIVVR